MFSLTLIYFAKLTAQIKFYWMDWILKASSAYYASGIGGFMPSFLNIFSGDLYCDALIIELFSNQTCGEGKL